MNGKYSRIEWTPDAAHAVLDFRAAVWRLSDAGANIAHLCLLAYEALTLSPDRAQYDARFAEPEAPPLPIARTVPVNVEHVGQLPVARYQEEQ